MGQDKQGAYIFPNGCFLCFAFFCSPAGRFCPHDRPKVKDLLALKVDNKHSKIPNLFHKAKNEIQY